MNEWARPLQAIGVALAFRDLRAVGRQLIAAAARAVSALALSIALPVVARLLSHDVPVVLTFPAQNRVDLVAAPALGERALVN